MKVVPCLLGVLAALVVVPGSATAGTFSGSCAIDDGKLSITPGATAQTREQKATIDAPLKCSGSLDGKGISGQSGQLKSEFNGPIGCTGTPRAMKGSGTVTVGSTSIPISFSFTLGGVNIQFQGNGATDGSISGSGDFPVDRNAGEMMRCASDGLKVARFDGTLRTTKTLVAGAAAAPAAPAVAPTLSFDRSQRAGSVLRSGGLRVRCTPSAAGACTVRVLRGSTLLAKGSKNAGAGQPVLVTAKLTAAGRRALKSSRGVSATVQVKGSGKSRSRAISFTR